MVPRIRSFLEARLPDAFVPSQYVLLDRLPRTASGKVDRTRLPAPDRARPDLGVEGRGAYYRSECTLTRIWCEVLGVERVGVLDNFFELGGDLILGIQIIARAHAAGLELSPRHLFEHQTIQALCRVCAVRGSTDPDQANSIAVANREAESAAAEVKAIPASITQRTRSRQSAGADRVEAARRTAMNDHASRVDVEDVYELSPMQLGMLFQTLLAPGSDMFVEQQISQVFDTLQPSILERAWNAVIESTPVLRTSFHWRDIEHPLQAVHRHATLAVEDPDIAGLEPDAAAAEFAEFVDGRRQSGFDLERPPLVRVALVKVGPHDARLVWQFHHMLLDGWSAPLVLHEVMKAYAAIATGQRYRPSARRPKPNLHRLAAASGSRRGRAVLARRTGGVHVADASRYRDSTARFSGLPSV